MSIGPVSFLAKTSLILTALHLEPQVGQSVTLKNLVFFAVSDCGNSVETFFGQCLNPATSPGLLHEFSYPHECTCLRK